MVLSSANTALNRIIKTILFASKGLLITTIGATIRTPQNAKQIAKTSEGTFPRVSCCKFELRITCSFLKLPSMDKILVADSTIQRY